MDTYLAGHTARRSARLAADRRLTGLPPLLIQAAEGDLALGDSLALEARARECGVDVELETYFTMTHAFQMFWSFLPEAVEALASAGRFITGGELSEDPPTARRPRRTAGARDESRTW